jgi:hypothetical protein
VLYVYFQLFTHAALFEDSRNEKEKEGHNGEQEEEELEAEEVRGYRGGRRRGWQEGSCGAAGGTTHPKASTTNAGGRAGQEGVNDGKSVRGRAQR